MHITASRAAGRLEAIPAGHGLPCPSRCLTERGERRGWIAFDGRGALGGNCFGIKGLLVIIQLTRQGFAIGAHGPGSAVAGTGADPPLRGATNHLFTPPARRDTQRGAAPKREVCLHTCKCPRGRCVRAMPRRPRLRTGSCAEPGARAAAWWRRTSLGSAQEAARQDAFPSSWRPPPGPGQSARPWKKGPGRLRPQTQSQPRPVACAGLCGARGAPVHAVGPSSRTGSPAR